MVKFKFFVDTPYGGHYNTHFAISEKMAKTKIEQWNAEFKRTNYSVKLISVDKVSQDDLPEYYICW